MVAQILDIGISVSPDIGLRAYRATKLFEAHQYSQALAAAERTLRSIVNKVRCPGLASAVLCKQHVFAGRGSFRGGSTGVCDIGVAA